MANFERLEPRSPDMPVFDDHDDMGDEGEDGSRLPLLIVIALLVLAAFAGVVWLAYTQGVERGRTDVVPRVTETQTGPASSSVQKAYQQPAAPAVEAENNYSPPIPPPPVTKAQTPAPIARTTVAAGSELTPPVPAARPPLAAPPQEKPVPAVPSTTKATAAPPPMTTLPKEKPAPAVPTPAKLAAAAPPKLAPTAAAESRPPQASANEAPMTSVKATHAPALLSQHVSGETAPPTPSQTAAAAPTALAPVTSSPTGQTPALQAPAQSASSIGYLLQIGAYKSQEDADAAWRAFESAHPAAAAYHSNVKAANLGDKGIWYRLRIGAFPDRDAANAMCAKLKSEGATCFLAR